jgi:integrase
MPKIDFNPMAIRNLKPELSSIEYFEKGRNHGDGAFGIRVSPNNKRTWFIMYQNEQGKIKRFSLGTYPEVSLKEARKAASEIMVKVHEGCDPTKERRAKLTAPRMTDLWIAYQDNLSMKSKSKVSSTIYEEHRRWNTVISPAIGHMKVEDITPGVISALLDKVARKAPVSANRLHTLLRIMFKVGLAKSWITIHPMQWLDKPGGSEPPRKRVLTDEEIHTLWACFDKVRPNARDALKLGLLTAQRPGEILSMRWEDVDLNNAIWRQENTKNGSTNLVPLSPQVMKILIARKPDSQPKNGWVFPSAYNRSRGAIEGKTRSTKEARKKLKQLSGVQDWTAHDLRRTARTIMSRLNIKQHIRERVLNHAQGGVVGVYDQHDYLHEKADALNKLGLEIDHILAKARPESVELMSNSSSAIQP